MSRHRYPCTDPPPQLARTLLASGHRHECIHDATHDAIAVEHQCSCGMTWFRTANSRRDRRNRLGRISVYVEPRDAWIGLYVAPGALYFCPLPFVVIKWARRVS